MMTGEAPTLLLRHCSVNVRDRMLKDAEEQAERDILNKTKWGPRFRKESTQDYLSKQMKVQGL
jgi:hypothetical protein